MASEEAAADEADEAEAAEFDYEKLTAKTAYEFVPANYEVYNDCEVWGKLNDIAEICVLLIRATNPIAIVQDEYRGELNYNRRGIYTAWLV